MTRGTGSGRKRLDPLPIDPWIPEICARLDASKRLVVTAPPGSGKTTRIPPALTAGGPVLVLQPRRVAARSLARRIAFEQGWELGREVGWQVRFERHFSHSTSLLIATEGILTARLQADPLLSDFGTVVLDEFHERSIHTDLALALLAEAMTARDDLRLVVMSATMEGDAVAEYLGGCPVVQIDARPHPVAVSYLEGVPLAEAVRRTLEGQGRHLLVFLPGAAEIASLGRELAALRLPAGVRVLPLHGTLDAAQQDAALAPCDGRKVILATNLAETSLTVEGVTDVVDSGFHKVLRFDPSTGIDRLETERITQDSAEQRAGRAGRLEPGRAYRLWDPRLQLRPRREPEILRIDLAAPFLAVYAWGGDPRRLRWFEPPPRERAEAAIELLERLELCRKGKLTPLGHRVKRFPIHPRLACLLAAAQGAESAARVCAVLSERRPAPTGDVHGGTCDPLWDETVLDDRLRRVVGELRRLAERLIPSARQEIPEEDLLKAVLAAFPDRVAQRRSPGSDRLLLCSGRGARLARQSCVQHGEYLVALEMISTRSGQGEEALVTQAALVQKEWLQPNGSTRTHWLDPDTGTVKSAEQLRYDSLLLYERPAAPDPRVAEALLVEALKRSGLDPAARRFLARAALAGIKLDVDQVLADACRGRIRLPEVDLARFAPEAARHVIDRLCPETVTTPTGRRIRVEYGDGEPRVAVRIQEAFGWEEAPVVGIKRQPLLVQLLAPNGRPVQMTRDLRSFWSRTYPEVRKQLRGRYPKHAWPEIPPLPAPERLPGAAGRRTGGSRSRGG
ncbi:MAG: ATP-dependent helicase HrpB [Acidobacteriota bacterium]